MTLREWMKKEKLTMRGAAFALGISQSNVHRCCAPSRGRTLELALLIEVRTDGEVSLYEHLTPEAREAIYGSSKRPTKKRGAA
jgi:plasmid maintenance system antidote protein VapI